MMELDRNITLSVNDFYLIKDKYKKLENNDEFQKILFNINETSDQLLSYKTYYNNIINEYNKVIKKFPYIISSTLKGKRKKLFFDN